MMKIFLLIVLLIGCSLVCGDWLGRKRYCTKFTFGNGAKCVCNDCHGYKPVCAIAEASNAKCYGQLFGTSVNIDGPFSGRCEHHAKCHQCYDDLSCIGFPLGFSNVEVTSLDPDLETVLEKYGNEMIQEENEKEGRTEL